MKEWHDDDKEFDEIPEAYMHEFEEKVLEETPEKITLEERGIEKEWWNEMIEEIDDREIQETEIERAKEIMQEERELERKLESGEISKSKYDFDKLGVLGRKKAAFATRCDLESEGITYDQIGELAEDVDYLIREAAGDPTPGEFKETVEKAIRLKGPGFVKEWADTKFEEGEMPEEIHEWVSEKAERHRK